MFDMQSAGLQHATPSAWAPHRFGTIAGCPTQWKPAVAVHTPDVQSVLA